MLEDIADQFAEDAENSSTDFLFICSIGAAPLYLCGKAPNESLFYLFAAVEPLDFHKSLITASINLRP
jgi:hypothetical protein